MAPYNLGMDPSMMGGDLSLAGYQSMSAMQNSLPQLNQERYADNFVRRQAIRQAFTGPGNRMTSPGVPRGGGGGQIAESFGGGMPNDNPDVSALNAQLQPYGLSEGHINPFMFFKDQNQDGSATWAGNHPKVAKAIEGAMLGAANTSQGNTIGENISNVARSVMSVPASYRQNQANQLQAPFDQASQLMKLGDDQANLKLKLAQAFHLQATGQAALDKPTKNYSGALYTSPSTGQVSGYNTVTNALDPVTGQPASDIQKVGGPTKPSAVLAPGVYPRGVTSTAQKATWDEYMQKGWDPTKQGMPMSDPGWNNALVKNTGRLAGASAGSGANARNNANQKAGALSQTDEANIANLKSQRDEASRRFAAADKLTPSEVRGRSEGTFSERLAGEKAERKAVLDRAQGQVDNAISGAGHGVNSTGTRTGGTSSKPKITIDGTKIIIQ